MANVQPTSGGIPLPSPPFIQVEGITNFRDLGGYPISASPNLSIRKGLIFRCGDPSKVTATGISTLQSLGITHTYDLRSINEIRKNTESGRGGVAEWDGCERVFVPIFKEEDYSPEGIAARFKDYSLGTAEVSCLLSIGIFLIMQIIRKGGHFLRIVHRDSHVLMPRS